MSSARISLPTLALMPGPPVFASLDQKLLGFRGHVARLSHSSRCTFSVSRLPASLPSPAVFRPTPSFVGVSVLLHRLRRVCVCLACLATLVSLPGSGLTNCESAIVVSCGLVCNLHDVRHCSVLQYTAWYIRCCRRNTFRSISFHGSDFQSSICRLLLTLRATLAIRPDLLHCLYLPSVIVSTGRTF
jgi:hypothetical protein